MSDRVNLEYLRKQAKTILKQCRAEDRASLERVRAQLPKLASMDLREIAKEIKLADVHHALAREHGCSSWGELKRHDEPLARFLAAARSGSLKSAERELTQFPDLVEESIHAACVIGDADAVRYYLEMDRGLLNAEDGGWPPLLYVCSSPFHRASERHAAGLVECAGVLLDHGADPNQSPALFRASISGNRSVAVLLYQRGATHASWNVDAKAKEAFWGIPADPRTMDQALADLYDHPEIVEQMRKRMADAAARHSGWFGKAGPQHVSPRDVYKPAHPGNQDYNLMIWEFLILRGIRPNWHDTSADTPLHYLALSEGGADQVKFFLEHGADPNVRRADGKMPYFLAVRAGNVGVAYVLRSHGADAGCVHPIDELVGACTRLDAEGARAIVRSHPDVVKTASPADREILVEAAAANRLDRVKLMAEVGFDVGGFGKTGATALHSAAWHGRIRMTDLLLDLGSPIDIRDLMFHSSPLIWAAHGSRNCRDADDEYCGVVEMLLDAGADPTSINRWGVGPASIGTNRVASLIGRFCPFR